jgi:hypothetical protein
MEHMNLSWLSRQGAEEVALVLFIVLLIAAEIGYRFGCRLHPKADEMGKGHFGIAQGVVLALLGLLLAFTFNMSSQRFETRQKLVGDEANAIHGLYLQSDLLPEPERQKFRNLLSQYLDNRLWVVKVKVSEA